MNKPFAAVAIVALAVSASLMLSHATAANAAVAAPVAAAAAPAASPTPAAAPAASVPQDRDDRKVREQHPHIRAAIRELNEAKRELQSAAHDFGGHREDALKATDEAIRQLQIALQYDKH